MSNLIEQRSDAWRLARAGKLTASRFRDVMAVKRDGKPTAARDKYMREIVFERLAGGPRHEINGQALKWGVEAESFAREAYELETGYLVEPSEFVVHPDYPFIGCSPDGLIGQEGGYESKCPMDEAVHIHTWLNGMPDEHMPQIQGCMWMTGRSWWTFVSYDPRLNERLRLFYQRIERDDAYIQTQLLPALLQFETEVEQMRQCLEKRAQVGESMAQKEAA